ncbi:GNAT family N-acetyltransferase [Pseudoduganella plicata]|uniref:N-acetyltransferase n=1 Tax=Pseudoduganella plicata TaxID=321984 RepID=A0A4P7BKH2_9BURK|nr:GNAT family N-acetyltransferase [Pseudoduganella plicata]QBQ38697.1 N-acetyltransferase [Pseudoduganella plicata]GGY84345.1 N-acetyltransferase [Pseudoduganella plicata]
MTIIRTARLDLRLWQPEDVAPFVQLNADPLVTEFLPGPVSPDEARLLFARQNALYEQHGTCYFAAALRETSELVGFVGVKHVASGLPFAPCYEIGWRLGSPWWGRGLATEGALAALRHAFDTLMLAEIVSFTVPDNLRSRRVMERIGMVRDVDGDFDHPALPVGHRLARHVLYRMPRAAPS